MGRETARRVVDLLFEEDAKENPYLNPSVAQALVLDFIGGEPLLAVELMDYFMQYFLWKAVTLNHRWAIHYMISISSNGTLMNTEAVRRFLTLYKGRVSLGITSSRAQGAPRRLPPLSGRKPILRHRGGRCAAGTAKIWRKPGDQVNLGPGKRPVFVWRGEELKREL